MFCGDLSPYQYTIPTGLPGVFSVGWLDAAQPFARGAVEDDLVSRLESRAAEPINLCRGLHRCNLCAAETGPEGNGEVWLRLGEAIYAAPALVCHYVRDHQYRPPQEFLEAIRSGALVEDAEACERIRRHQDRLAVCPQPHDILVPRYQVQVFWASGAFDSLTEFRSYWLDSEFRSWRASRHCVDDACCAIGETGDPAKLFSELVDGSPPGRPRPSWYRWRMVFLEGEWTKSEPAQEA